MIAVKKKVAIVNTGTKCEEFLVNQAKVEEIRTENF